jgi:hypothetical protein
MMNDKPFPKDENTAEFSFLGNPRKEIRRERDGQYSHAGDLELGEYSVTWERAFDQQGRPLEWKFFEDSALSSSSEYRYEGDECILTEKDASGTVIEVTKQKPFSVTVQGSERTLSLPGSWPVPGTGLVASLKYEFEFDSKGNWIKWTTTTTVSSTTVVHVAEREITYW